MKLEPALQKAWGILTEANLPRTISVRFLSHGYAVDIDNRKIRLSSSGATADEGLSLLILHYLARKLTSLPPPTGEWLSLSGLSVAVGLDNAFKKRAVELLVEKYGSNPRGIYRVLETAPGRRIDQADAAIVLDVFEGVPALIQLWKADDEFGPEGNLLFDRNVTGIFCSEDIVVLAEVVARHL